MRVGLVGARRVRQGLGPFVARDLWAAGAEVAAVLGRTEATAQEAVRGLAAHQPADQPPIASTADPERFFDEGLDAVCVLSPPGTHGAHVEAALARRCHVLAEKPFLWDPETDWVTRAQGLEDRFAAAGLVLATNTQWPFTLATAETALGRALVGTRSFEMMMQPASSGYQMIGDAVPHPLSLAQALSPGIDAAEDVRCTVHGEESMIIEAKLTGPASSIDLRVTLDGRPVDARGEPARGPREAWLCFDSERLDRSVRTSDYALFLRRGAALFDLPDPLTLCVGDFVARARAAGPAPGGTLRQPSRTISARLAMLRGIADAFPGPH